MLIERILFERVLDHAVISSKESSGYSDWLTEDTESIPRYRAFSFWNITNKEDVLQGGKPLLQEVGPYVYRYYSQKLNVSFSEDGTRATYSDFKKMIFDEHLRYDCGLVPTFLILCIC